MIDPQVLMRLESRTEQRYSERDCWLYALGLGLGGDPVDEADLAFVARSPAQVLPTFALVLAQGPSLIADPRSGIDFAKVVHGSQSLTVHRPLAPAATVVSHASVTNVVDKGEGRGAIVSTTRELYDKDSGEHLATSVQDAFCRGDGGFGGNSAAPAAVVTPEREPDLTIPLQTSPRAALIYRLSGDLNPLHFDPARALAVGFPRPILHGLAVFGMAGAGMIRHFGGGEAARLRQLSARFSAPVLPGDAIELRCWREGAEILFEGRLASGKTALAGGSCRIESGGGLR